MARGARRGLPRFARSPGGGRSGRAAAGGILRAGARLADACGSARADRLDARSDPTPLRRRGDRPVAHRAGVGARSGRRSGGCGRAVSARGRPPLPGERIRAGPVARAVPDRERRQAGRAISDRRAAPLSHPLQAAGRDRRLPARVAERGPSARRVRGRRREVRRLARHQRLGVHPRLARPILRRDCGARGGRRSPPHHAGRGAA